MAKYYIARIDKMLKWSRGNENSKMNFKHPGKLGMCYGLNVHIASKFMDGNLTI